MDTTEERRIAEAVGKWNGLGESGTYKADAQDYGAINVAVLRDVRFLLARLKLALAVVEAAEAELVDSYGDYCHEAYPPPPGCVCPGCTTKAAVDAWHTGGTE